MGSLHLLCFINDCRLQLLPRFMDVSGPELFHPGAHAAPKTEEPAHPGSVGKAGAHFSPPVAWYLLQNPYSHSSMTFWNCISNLNIYWNFRAGVGVPCVVCRDTFGSPDIRRGCWNREHRALKQHIWLGRLVQWWGIMGLLPKYPGTDVIIRRLI